MPAKGKKSGKEGRLSLLPEVTTARGPSHARTKPRLRPTPFKATSSERRLRTDSHAPRHLHGEPELLVTRIFCVTNLHSDDGVHGVTLVRVHAGGIVKQRAVKSCKQCVGTRRHFAIKLPKTRPRVVKRKWTWASVIANSQMNYLLSKYQVVRFRSIRP